MRIHIRDKNEYVATYRHVQFPKADEWFLGAWFGLKAGDAKESTQRLGSCWLRVWRVSHSICQSAGSTFRNPEGNYAAKLIEECGLKGYIIGGAQVSEKHANFIVNVGNATALDIELLIKHIKEVVLAQRGVALQQEVRVIGEYA